MVQRIRMCAARSLKSIIKAISVSSVDNKQQVMRQLSDKFILNLWQCAEYESEPEVIIHQIQAIRDIIELNKGQTGLRKVALAGRSHRDSMVPTQARLGLPL